MNKQKMTTILFIVNAIALSGMYLLETIKYPGVIEHNLGIQIAYLAIVSLFIQGVLISLSRKEKFLRPLLIYFIELTVIFSFIAVLLYCFEQSSFPNAVFSTLGIHPISIKNLTLFFWGNTLLLIVPQILLWNKKILAITPVLFLIFLFFLEKSSLTFFISIGSENSIIEWISFFLFLVASLAFLVISTQYLKINKLFSFIFVLIALVMFFLAGEEISWGKWIFQFTTPEYFTENNLQQETTIHNLRPFHSTMWYAYIGIGLAGGILPFFKKYLLILHSFFVIIPPIYLTTYFLPLLVYGLYRVGIGPIEYKTWEESIELLFALGMLLHAWYLQKNSKKKY